MTSSCAGCAVVGRPYGLVVDHRQAEPIPDEVKRFIQVGEEAEPRRVPDSLERCPLCGQHFLYEHVYDSDIFQPTDESRWTAVTSERARGWLETQERVRDDARKRRDAFARKARRRWKAVLPSLSSDERAVFEFLAAAGFEGARPEKIDLGTCLASADTDRVIAALVARELIRFDGPDTYRDMRGLARYVVIV